MASSSLAPMRRYRSSCRPALLSKNHFPPLFTSGTGKGQSSLPTRRNARLRVLGVHGDALLFAGLSGEISGVLPVLREFAAEYNVIAVRDRRFPSAQPHRTFRPHRPAHLQPAAECQSAWLLWMEQRRQAEPLSPRIAALRTRPDADRQAHVMHTECKHVRRNWYSRMLISYQGSCVFLTAIRARLSAPPPPPPPPRLTRRHREIPSWRSRDCCCCARWIR